MPFDPNNPLGDLMPKKPGAAAAPSPVAPAAPAPATPAPVPAPPPVGAAPNMPPRTQTPGTAYGDKWSDLIPGNNKPARPGPQSWFDWFSKTYNPSASDFAKQYADAWSYHLAPLAAQGALAAGSPVPKAVSPEALRAQTRTASENLGPMGPFVSALGYATSPLTYGVVGPASRVVGAGAELAPAAVTNYVSKNLIQKGLEGGTTSALTAGAHSAGEGDSPEQIALNAAANIPAGAAIGGAVSKLPLGRNMPADVTQSTADTAAAAEQNLSNTKVSSKDLGFKIDKTDPSLADLMENQDWLKTVRPEDDPAGGAPIVQKRIAQALSSNPAVAEFQKAQAQADWAKTLERWGSNEGLPGSSGDVRAQAADAAQNYPPDAPENTTLQDIARVPDPKDRVVSPWARRTMIGLGGAGGEGVGYMAGYPGGGTVGAQLGNAAADFLDWGLTPSAGNPKLQAQVQQSYPALTGQSVGPGGNEALTNALLRLYGVGVQPAGQ